MYRDLLHSLRQRTGMLVVGPLALTLSLSSAPLHADPPPTGIPQDTFVMALQGDPWSFDPAVVVRLIESRLVHNMFEGLYMPPPGDGRPVPAVATGYELSDDETVYTFHLSPEARWSNGDQVTAGDFVTAWRRVLNPETQSHYGYFMYSLKNGRAFAAGEVPVEALGVTAVDDQTLRVELEAPVPYFIELTAFCTFFPVHTASIEAYGNVEAFHPAHLVSNGPYVLQSYVPEREVVLGPNPHYWDREALRITNVRALIFSDPAATLSAYHQGTIEWAAELPQDNLPGLRGRPDFRTHPMFGTYYFRINVNQPGLDQPRVRRALATAIDREALCRDVLDGLCEVAESFVPPIPGFESSDGLSFDPEEARQLLSQAGYPGGEGFPRVRVLFNTLELHERLARAVQEMWRTHLNVQVDLLEEPWDTYLDRLNRTDYQVARFGWIGDYLDPDSFLYLMVSENTQMNGGWSNAEYDNLVHAASRETSPSGRAEMIREAEAIVMAEMPIIPLFYYVQYQLVSPLVGGFEMNLRDVHLVRYMYKQPAGG